MKAKYTKNKLVLVAIGFTLFLMITGMLVGQDSILPADTTSVIPDQEVLAEAATENATPDSPQIASGGFTLMSLLRGVLGLFAVLAIAYLLSSSRKNVAWRTVLGGLGLQIIIAILVLKVSAVQAVIEFVGKMFIKVLNFTEEGSVFLFGQLIDGDTMGFMFAFQILPTIVFFSALSSVLYYYGIVQGIVKVFAWVMTRLLKLSGAESLSATGNIFLGQTESPLLIKAFIYAVFLCLYFIKNKSHYSSKQ